MAPSFFHTALLLAALYNIRDCRCYSSSNQEQAVDCTRAFCELILSDELIKRYKVSIPDGGTDVKKCADCKLTVQLVLDGYSWIGFGVSGNGGMVGSHVVIGEPGISEPKSYYLNGKDQSLISRSNIVLEDATIDFINEQTIMEFTTTFESLGVESPLDTEPAGISMSGISSFIWAHGKDGENEMKYHGSNRAVYKVSVGTGESSETTADKMTMSESISSNQSKWLAHGILAFVSCGICAPVAITSAIYRNFNKKLTKWWFYIHLGCNSLNYFFTFVVFCLAVSTVKKEGSPNWYHAHNKMGLAIFLFATFQVMGGVLRPKTNTNTDKSITRQRWELTHNIFGIVVYLMGAWQMYTGLSLYYAKYNSSVKPKGVVFLYIVWTGLWTGLVVGGTIYKRMHRKKDKTVVGDSSVDKTAQNEEPPPNNEDLELTESS